MFSLRFRQFVFLLVMLILFFGCKREAAEKAFRVERVYPGCGPQERGIGVVITGKGFSAGDSVLFGKTPAATVQVVSATSIRATTPALPAGSYPVTVSSRSGARRTVVNGYRSSDPSTFDPNGDCKVDSSDVFYLNNFLNNRGPAPVLSGDANGDRVVDARDVDWLVARLYTNAPASGAGQVK